jgi:hypothetical protein
VGLDEGDVDGVIVVVDFGRFGLFGRFGRFGRFGLFGEDLYSSVISLMLVVMGILAEQTDNIEIFCTNGWGLMRRDDYCGLI